MGKKIEYINEILKNFADLLEEMGEEKVDVEAVRELREYFLNGDSDIVMAPELASAYKAILEREFHKVLYGDINGDRVRGVPYGYSYGPRTEYDTYRRRMAYKLDWSGSITVDQYSLAKLIANKMNEILDTYGFVTVAEYFDIYNEVCPESQIRTVYVDNKYGWTKDTVQKFYVIHQAIGSWSIDIPTPVRLNDRSTEEKED